MRAVAWLVLSCLGWSCVTMQPTPQPGSCGLVLGEPVVRRRPPAPQTDLYLGLLAFTGGLSSLGMAAGYGVMAADHRDEANQGGRVRSLLLDKADAAEERANVAAAVGVPLLLLGAALLWLQRSPAVELVPLPAGSTWSDEAREPDDSLSLTP
jgi:hypothetical protein